MGGDSGNSYITDSAGNVYPGASNPSSIDWTKLGGTVSKGFQSFGNSYAQGQQDNSQYMKPANLYQSPGEYQGSQLPNLIQQQQPDLLAMLQRLLGGQS